MRIAIGIGLAALLTLAPAASAQGPIGVALAPGEILVELSAVGRARTPPDQLEIDGGLYATGASDAAARRAFDALSARVRAALRGLGLADGEIDAGEASANSDYQSLEGYNMSVVDVDENGMSAAPDPATRYSYSSTLRIRTRNVALAPRIEQVLSEASVTGIDGARYALSDPAAARRAARADAIARARAQAEDYAAGLNMRVARMVRISERSGPSFMEMMMSGLAGGSDRAIADLQRELTDNPDGPGGVNTIVFLGVDFALAPR